MKLFFLAVISTLVVGVGVAQSAQGLNYKYFEGSWTTLPDFNSLTPVKSGTYSTPNLDPRNREVNYALLYTGFITIPATGSYTFETVSDDGSKLYIGNYDFNTVALVNNDGLHGTQTRTGTISLTAGVYPISLSYMQGTGNQIWELWWSSTAGLSRQKIPNTVFATTNSTSVPANGTTGMSYNYYEGVWSTLPDFNSISPVKTGTLASMNLSPRNREVNYAFMYSGYITIPTTGTYTFETYTDDGSKLYIGSYGYNTTPVVNNDGLHGNQAVSGSISLTAGVYPIVITYFQNGGNQTFQVSWSSNSGISKQIIPDNVLSTNATTTVTPPSTNGISYNYYEGTFNTLPDFTTLTPVKSGTTANVDLSPRNREVNYAFVWQGSINVPTTGTYTFETVSDDGSKVYLNASSVSVVNNDGLHTSQSKTGSLMLNAGLNPITITYFQQGGSQIMELYWSSSVGLTRQKVPDNVLTPSTITPPVAEAMAPVAPVVPVVTSTNTSGNGGLTGVNNYYFSTTNGDDSRTAAQAKNASTPWKTIGKLNTIMSTLKSGDAVLFNRGDVFDGGINMTTSGITFSSYGSGLKPVINGFTQVTGWTSIGNGIWQASCNSSDVVNNVIMNGISQQLGRYPNLNDPNKGYLTLESHSGTSSITDLQLSGSPNWTGAEVVIRKQHWVIDRGLITNHSGNTIYYNSPTAHEPNDNYGYFIQNSPQTLDQLGEWYFDPNQKLLKIYFGSNNANSYDVRASTVNTLATLSGVSNIMIDNLFFQGADVNGINIANAQSIHVQNSNVDLSGTNAVTAQTVTNFIFENNSITNTNNNALQCNANTTSTITNNSVQNTGLRPGMGQSGNQQHNGIYVEGSGNTIQLNTVLNTGLSGITFAGENLLVKNNYVNTFCLTVDDGGGIYGWGDLTKYNRKIVGNIVLNGIGAFEGTTDTGPAGSSGIYHDDESANVEMTDNTVAACSRAGIFIHNSHEMVVRNNTVFNSVTQLSMVHDPITINNPIRNVTVDNNILFSKTSSQYVMEMGTLTNDLANFGTYTNNHYARPIDDNGIIYNYYRNSSNQNVFSYYDVAGWKAAYGGIYDQASTGSPMKIPSYKVSSFNGGNRYTNSTFSSNVGGFYCLSSPGKCAVSWSSGGKLDGGAVQVTFDGSGGAINTVGSYIDIGPTTAGKTYQIKFSLLGYNAGKTVKAFILDGSTYAHVSDNKYFALTTTRTENDLLYFASSSANSTILSLEVAGPDIPFWFDNLQVYDVNTVVTNPDDYIKFVFNPTNSATTVSLSGNFVDARSNYYSGSITLAPFTSAVLINQAASQITDDAAATQRLATTTTESVAADATESKALSVNISPNPTRDNVQITINAPQGTQKSSLTINSISGQTMKVIPVSALSQRLTLDVSAWSKGVYIVNYNCDGHIIYKKFVKQ